MFATLYVVYSAQNILIYYSVQYFILKKNLFGLIILPDPDNNTQSVRYPADTGYRTDIRYIHTYNTYKL